MNNKIAFFLDTKSLGDAWSTDLELFPLSGTHGATLSVATKLKKKGINVLLITTSQQSCLCAPLLESVVVADFAEACIKASNTGAKAIVFPIKCTPAEFAVLREEKLQIDLYGWAHNTPSKEWLRLAESSNSLLKIICVSNAQALDIAHRKIYRKVVVIPNLVFPAEQEVFTDIDVSACRPYCLYVGALQESKGFDKYAAVWPEVIQANPSISMLVCGSLSLYAAKEGAENRGKFSCIDYEKKYLDYLGGSFETAKKMKVTFLGSLDKKKLYYLMQNAEFVLVNPNTKGSLETFCLSAVEAMRLGVPVIGGRAGALVETVKHKKGGLLSKNSVELKRNLIKLSKERGLRDSLSESAKDYFNEKFSEEAALDRWASLFFEKSVTRHTYYPFAVVTLKQQIKRFIGLFR